MPAAAQRDQAEPLVEVLHYQRSLSICAATLLQRTLEESDMIAKLEAFFDALFAPLARELARMPASAFRHLLPGF
jgi:hypothetical protein